LQLAVVSNNWPLRKDLIRGIKRCMKKGAKKASIMTAYIRQEDSKSLSE
jgi:hypothetical protein